MPNESIQGAIFRASLQPNRLHVMAMTIISTEATMYGEVGTSGNIVEMMK